MPTDLSHMPLLPRNIEFGYTNWRGRHSQKQVEVRTIYFGTEEAHYPGQSPQWYLVGIDLDKNAEMSYQMTRMEDVKVVS